MLDYLPGMKDKTREAHILRFQRLSLPERLDWALNTGWDNYYALPGDRRVIFDRLRKNGKSQRQSELG